jgi:DNA polymerase III delta subunit
MATRAGVRSPRSVKSGASRALLILGDPTVADQRARAAIDEWLPLDRQSVDLEVVRVPDQPMERAVELLQQVGLFGAGRCVWVRMLPAAKRKRHEPAQGQADGGAEGRVARDAASESREAEAEGVGEEGAPGSLAEQMESLVSFLEGDGKGGGGLPAACSLVITAPALDKRMRLVRWFEAREGLVDLRIPFESGGTAAKNGEGESRERLARFIQGRIQSNGFPALSTDALRAILERAGSDMGQLAAELDKLCLAAPAGAPIGVELVQLRMADLARSWVLDLIDALGKRDLRKAQLTLDRLLRQGEPAFVIVASLATRVSDLWVLRPCVDRLPLGALDNGRQFIQRHYPSLPQAVRSRYRDWRAYFLLLEASRFPGDTLRRLHRDLLEIDLRLKSTRVPASLLLGGFVQRACSLRA